MVSSRLKQYIDYQGNSVRQFETDCGLNNGTLARMIRNNTTLTSDNLTKVLESNPDLDADWLLTGVGEMLKSKSVAKDELMSKLEKDLAYHMRVNQQLMDMLDKFKK